MSSAAFRRAMSPPSPEELIRRARDLVPEIRARAEETERNRRISPEIIAKVRDAELLRTTRPREFGGFEYDAVVALEIALTISAACASTGWAVNGALSNGISFGHYPIETQRELWGDGSDPFSCACFAPTGAAVPADGGYRLSGKWSFASGVDHASWIRLGAFIRSPNSDDPIAWRRRKARRRRLFPIADRRCRNRRQLVCLWPVRHRQQRHHRRKRLCPRASRVAV